MARYEGLVDVATSAPNEYLVWTEIDGGYAGYKLFTGPPGTGLIDLSPYGLHKAQVDADGPSHDNLYDVTKLQDDGPLQPEFLVDHTDRKSRASDSTNQDTNGSPVFPG
jgi:hypothetical protein